jgi:hypothetical protein
MIEQKLPRYNSGYSAQNKIFTLWQQTSGNEDELLHSVVLVYGMWELLANSADSAKRGKDY